MWQAIFFVGLVFVVIMAFKDPVWLACAAAYVYFAIPFREFGVPSAPYQAGFFGLAFLSSFLYYRLFQKWGVTEIHEEGERAAREALDEAQPDLNEALVVAVLQDKLPGEIRQAAVTAAEGKAIPAVNVKAPAAIMVPVRRAVRAAIAAAAEQGEREVLKIKGLGAQFTKGNLRVAIEERVVPIMRDALDATLLKELKYNIDETIKEDAKTPSQSASRGPLGIPMPNGPIGGVLTNAGFWLHIIFVVLTYRGAKYAVYSYSRAAPRVQVAVLLLIPLLALLTSVRTAKQFRMFIYAWMFGVWHICMNGVSYWLQYGGRADNAGGQGGEANFLGAIIVAVAPVAFGLAINAKHNLEKLIFLGGAGCYALGVLASGSRAGLLALIGGMGYWLMNTTRRGMAMGLACMAVAGFLVAAPESFWTKMGTILGKKDNNPWVRTAVEPSKHERIVLWGLAIKIFKDHPAWGVGPLNYPEVSAVETDFTDPYKGQRGLQAHNTWLQLLAEYGVIGSAAWAGAYFLSILCYRRARSRMKKYPGWEWYGALCLGLESGALSTFVVLCFNSFQWYDYIYWHMITGPMALEIARRTGDRLDWLAPGRQEEVRPPPRYGKPTRDGLALGNVDLAEVAPLSSAARRG